MGPAWAHLSLHPAATYPGSLASCPLGKGKVEKDGLGPKAGIRMSLLLLSEYLGLRSGPRAFISLASRLVLRTSLFLSLKKMVTVELRLLP